MILKLLQLYLFLQPFFSYSPAIGPDPCRPEAREHNAGRARPAAVPCQSNRLWQRVARQQGCLQHLPAEQIL